MRRYSLVFFLILAGLSLGSFALAENQSSANFQNKQSTFAPTVFSATSSNYLLLGAVDPIISTSTSLTFKIRHGVPLKDIAAAATPTTPIIPTPTGGGGGSNIPSVTFSGYAYPQGHVTILKDGAIATVIIADHNGYFATTLFELSTGNYNFAIFAEDTKNNRSPLLAFPIHIVSGEGVMVTGIFMAPTIALDKTEVKLGDNLIISGQTIPGAKLDIIIDSNPKASLTTQANGLGEYTSSLYTAPFTYGGHTAHARAMFDSQISNSSFALPFIISNISIPVSKKFMKGDLNNDGHVNLIDFSIAAYWYKRELSDTFKKVEIERLNGDGQINLSDFSIMAFYWTG